MYNNSDLQSDFLNAFEPHRHALWRFVRATTRSALEAEDLMGDTILQAYEAFPKLQDRQAMLSWLFTIASRLYKRQRWRARLFGELSDEYADGMAHSDPLPDTHVDISILYDALAKLPHKHREAVVLMDILGMTLAEIQAIQGGTISAIKSRVSRGRAELARRLSPESAPSKEGARADTLPVALQSIIHPAG